MVGATFLFGLNRFIERVDIVKNSPVNEIRDCVLSRMNSLGTTLREVVRALDLQVGSERVPSSTVYRWLSGKGDIRTIHLSAIFRLLGLEVVALGRAGGGEDTAGCPDARLPADAGEDAGG